MDTEPNGEEEASEGDDQSLPLAETASERPLIEPVHSDITPAIEQESGSEPTHPHPPAEVKIANQPLLVHVTKDDELSTFERRTIFFGSVGVFLATLSMVAAGLAGYFVYQQFVEMEHANTLASVSAQRSRHDSAEASIATAKQLAILQNQLIQQRNAVQIDQRPWIKFEPGGEFPAGTDPNNAKERKLSFATG